MLWTNLYLKNKYSNHYKLIKKLIKVAVTILTGYINSFVNTEKNNDFYFSKSVTNKGGFNQITVPPGA